MAKVFDVSKGGFVDKDEPEEYATQEEVDEVGQQYAKNEQKRAEMDVKVPEGEIKFVSDAYPKGYTLDSGERKFLEKPTNYENKALNTNPPPDDVYREYGNNFFELWTYDVNSIPANNGLFKMAGILSEIPSFSMGASWESGPRSRYIRYREKIRDE